MQNVFYWRDVYNHSEKFSPYQEKIEKLLSGEHGGLHLEKIKNFNPAIYSIRINLKDRLLFTTYQGALCLLDVVLEHEYEKSRFLKHPGILKRFIAQLDAEDAQHKNLEFEETPAVQGIGCKANSISFFPLEPQQRKLLHFTPVQETALTTEIPVIMHGSAGSGKTCVVKAMAVAHLRNHSDQKVLILTKSPILVEKLQAELAEELQGCDQALQCIEVQTYDAYLPKEYQKIEEEAEHFKTWLKKEKKKLKSPLPLNDDQLFFELRQLSGLTEDTYCQLGRKQSSVQHDKDMRALIYGLYQSYISQLRAERLISSSFFELEQKLDADLILVDEAQDFSTQQLANIRHFSINNQVAFFLGDHQVLFDGISKHSVIKDILFQGNISELHLPQCFRLPIQVAKFSNQVIALKRCILGGKADKVESDTIVVDPDKASPGHISWLDMRDAANIQAMADSPHTAVICFDDDVSNSRALTQSLKVFTPEAYKGLEDDTIILAGMFGHQEVEAIARLIRDRRLTLDDLEHAPSNRPCGQIDESIQLVFNRLITAMTRAKHSLVILENMDDKDIARRVAIFKQIYDAVVDKRPKVAAQAEVPKATQEDWLAQVRELFLHGHQKMAEDIFIQKCGGSKEKFHVMMGIGASSDDDEKSAVVPIASKKPSKSDFEKYRKLVAAQAAPTPSVVNKPTKLTLFDKLMLNFEATKLKDTIKHYIGTKESLAFYCNPLFPEASQKISFLDLIKKDEAKRRVFFEVLLNDTEILCNFPIGVMLKKIEKKDPLKEFFELLKEAQTHISTWEEPNLNRYKPIYILNIRTLYEEQKPSSCTIAKLIAYGMSLDPGYGKWSRILGAAVNYQDQQTVKFIFDYGCELHEISNSLVHQAVMNNDDKMIELLHQKNISLETPYTGKRIEPSHQFKKIKTQFSERAQIENETPLFMAVKERKFECFKTLIECGARLDVSDSEGMELIHVVTQFASKPIPYLEILLHKGISVDNKDRFGRTPVFHACLRKSEQLAVFNFLLAHGAVTSDIIGGYSLYHAAALSGATDIISRIHELKLPLAELTDDKKTPAQLVAELGHLDTLKHILDLRPDFLEKIDKDRNTLAHAAANNDNHQCLDYLLGVRPAFLEMINVHGDNLAHIACKKDKLPILAYLAIKAPDLFNQPNRYHDTVCHLALKSKQLDIFYQCSSIDFNIPDFFDRTGAHYLAALGLYSPLVANLVENLQLGISVNWNAQDDIGDTPAHFALRNHHFSFVEFMFTKSLIHDIVPNLQGETLVHLAAKMNWSYIFDTPPAGVKFDYQTPNKSGNTPEQIAREAGHIQLADKIRMLTAPQLGSNRFFADISNAHAKPTAPSPS